MRILAKIVKSNFFRTLETNQRLAATPGAFMQETQLNLAKSELYGVLTCPIFNTHPQAKLHSS